MEDLIVMESRWLENKKLETGIFVRALTPDGYKSVDIALLTPESLLKWLKSSGGNNPLAENAVGMLLAHGHLH